MPAGSNGTLNGRARTLCSPATPQLTCTLLLFVHQRQLGRRVFSGSKIYTASLSKHIRKVSSAGSLPHIIRGSSVLLLAVLMESC